MYTCGWSVMLWQKDGGCIHTIYAVLSKKQHVDLPAAWLLKYCSQTKRGAQGSLQAARVDVLEKCCRLTTELHLWEHNLELTHWPPISVWHYMFLCLKLPHATPLIPSSVPFFLDSWAESVSFLYIFLRLNICACLALRDFIQIEFSDKPRMYHVILLFCASLKSASGPK